MSDNIIPIGRATPPKPEHYDLTQVRDQQAQIKQRGGAMLDQAQKFAEGFLAVNKLGLTKGLSIESLETFSVSLANALVNTIGTHRDALTRSDGFLILVEMLTAENARLRAELASSAPPNSQ